MPLIFNEKNIKIELFLIFGKVFPIFNRISKSQTETSEITKHFK